MSPRYACPESQCSQTIGIIHTQKLSFAKDFSHGQEGQDWRGDFQGIHPEYTIDVGRRRLHRRFGMVFLNWCTSSVSFSLLRSAVFFGLLSTSLRLVSFPVFYISSLPVGRLFFSLKISRLFGSLPLYSLLVFVSSLSQSAISYNKIHLVFVFFSNAMRLAATTPTLAVLLQITNGKIVPLLAWLDEFEIRNLYLCHLQSAVSSSLLSSGRLSLFHVQITLNFLGIGTILRSR